MENISQGIAVSDSDARLVAWNRRYLEMLGAVFWGGSYVFVEDTSIEAMIAKGSSRRGLSDVMMERSANSPATLPIRTRLPVSRSPPQPKTLATTGCSMVIKPGSPMPMWLMP